MTSDEKKLVVRIVDFHRACSTTILFSEEYQTAEQLLALLLNDTSYQLLSEVWDADLELLAEMRVVEKLMVGLEPRIELHQRMGGSSALWNASFVTREPRYRPILMLADTFEHFRQTTDRAIWIQRGAKALQDAQRLPEELRMVHVHKVVWAIQNLLVRDYNILTEG